MRERDELCPHGMATYCEDCPPVRIDTGATTPHGPRAARVLPQRNGFFVVVERRHFDASYGMFTYHLTRRGARRAAELWERHGELEGWAP